MNPVASLYGAAALARRRWYARHPEARLRLERPVISVGNLTVGGSGKTPAVRYLAHLLLRMGERPSILSRGYGRRAVSDEVVVVSDGRRVLADLDHAGDEPLMLARDVPGAAVLVSPDRHPAGALAESSLGCTVHLLDDGFQHMKLDRDIDLLLVGAGDQAETPLPGGRLREPLTAASAADALVVDGSDEDAQALVRCLGVSQAFRATRGMRPPRAVVPFGDAADLAPGVSVFALAGIARPERFFAAVREQGWRIVGEGRVRDHHRYSAADVARTIDLARSRQATAIMTTEKDAIRLEPHGPFALPIVWLPLELTIEPAEIFRQWLALRLASATRARVEARAKAAGR
ncbi:MAG TPA: tetraacyldisaccharide 4'-kinase [Vicinamibacterales bacterium]